MSLTIVADTITRTYTPASQIGYDVKYIETTAGEPVLENRVLEFKHTIPTKISQPRRHLIVVAQDYTDSVTGKVVNVPIHIVIKQPQGVPSSVITEQAGVLAAILDNSTFVERVLQGLSA